MFEFAFRRMILFSLVALLLGATSVPAAAQTQASSALLEGTVSDESGAVVPGATVEIRRPVTNWSRTTTTDSSGRYVLPSVPVGTYQVTVTLQGFQTAKAENIILTVGARITLDFTLKVAGVA